MYVSKECFVVLVNLLTMCHACTAHLPPTKVAAMAWVWYWDFQYDHWASYWQPGWNYKSEVDAQPVLPNDQYVQPDGAQPNEPHDERLDKWQNSDTLMAAEKDYRLLSLLPTPIEYQMIQDNLQESDAPNADKQLREVDLPPVTRLMRNWGKECRLKDAKDVLSGLASKGNLSKGVPITAGTLEFVFFKGLVASGREYERKLPNSLYKQDPCYCLPTMCLKGCGHGMPAVLACKKSPREAACKMCTKCMRCHQFLWLHIGM